MDDTYSGSQGLQQIIQFLRCMEPEARQQYLAWCEFELGNPRNDGYSAEYYRKYLEAAKHV